MNVTFGCNSCGSSFGLEKALSSKTKASLMSRRGIRVIATPDGGPVPPSLCSMEQNKMVTKTPVFLFLFGRISGRECVSSPLPCLRLVEEKTVSGALPNLSTFLIFLVVSPTASDRPILMPKSYNRPKLLPSVGDACVMMLTMKGKLFDAIGAVLTNTCGPSVRWCA